MYINLNFSKGKSEKGKMMNMIQFRRHISSLEEFNHRKSQWKMMLKEKSNL
jgi:hypothetical protein